MTIKNRLETETATYSFADYRTRVSKTRVSVSCEESEVLEATGLVRPPYGSSRGDGSAEDAAWKKYNRAELKVLRAKAEALLEKEGITYGKMYWSRTAGCSCGCSPAFIIDRMVTVKDPELGYDRRVEYIYPTFKKAEPVAEVEAPKGADAIKAAIEGLTPALPTAPKGAAAIKAAIAAA
jgi:hypothetical protein